MNRFRLSRILFLVLVTAPFLLQQSCKKQPKCGCGKDMIFELKEKEVMIQYSANSNSALFYPLVNNGATYYFCNPGAWIDTLKTMNTSNYLLLSGKVYYECNYLYQNSNYYYQLPPVYQVEVTAIVEDNYGK